MQHKWDNLKGNDLTYTSYYVAFFMLEFIKLVIYSCIHTDTRLTHICVYSTNEKYLDTLNFFPF